MYYVRNEYKGEEIYDPSWNLAIEYYLLNEIILDEPIVYFYVNDNSVIVGKNQNTYDEVNLDYIEANNVNVVRRFSGGGAVYHDRGVLNFCFITEDDGNSFRNFKRFTEPIIDALHDMGVDGAELRGRNDLVIDDRKFSGNAMYTTKGRMTAHGTLMFNSEIDAVVDALKPNKQKLESKGIKSVRSRVTNIMPYLDEEYQNYNTRQFREKLIQFMFDVEDMSQVKEYVLTDEDWDKIAEFRGKYTGNWDWNYGQSPDFDVTRDERLSIGTVEAKMDIRKGHIQNIKIFGDFFGKGEIKDVEDKLIGAPYSVEGIKSVLEEVDIDYYFGDVTVEELLKVFY